MSMNIPETFHVRSIDYLSDAVGHDSFGEMVDLVAETDPDEGDWIYEYETRLVAKWRVRKVIQLEEVRSFGS